MEFPRPLCLLLVLLTIVSSTQAHKFYVGGNGGWVPNPSENYNQWAGRNRFQINDTLVFKYKKGSDSVLEVNKEDYDKCNKTNPIKKFEDGDTEFKFDRSGPFYFISGKDQNCEKGHQKLTVAVLSPRGQSQTPPPPSPPKSPSPSPKPSPSPVPSLSPSHPPSPSPAVSPVPTPSGHSPSPSPTVSPVPTPSGHSPSPSPAVSPVPTPSGSPPSPSPAVSPVPSSGPPAPSPGTSPVPTGKSPSPSPRSSQGPVGGPPAPSSATPPSSAGKAPSSSAGSSPPPSPGGSETAPAPSRAWAAGPSGFLGFLVSIAVGAVLLR